MELATTLRLCREHHACKDQYDLLANALGPEWGDDQPIPLTMLLDLDAGPEWTSFSNALWALRAVPPEQTEARDRLAAAFSAQLLGFVPGPPEYWVACRKLRAYSMGEASQMEVQQAARAAWTAWVAWDGKVSWGGRVTWAAWATWTAWIAWEAWGAWDAWDALAARDATILRWLLDEEAIEEPTQDGRD